MNSQEDRVVEVSTEAYRWMCRVAIGGGQDWMFRPGPTQLLCLDGQTYNALVDLAIESKQTFDELLIERCKQELRSGNVEQGALL